MPPDDEHLPEATPPAVSLPLESGGGGSEGYALELRAEVLRTISAANEWRRGESDRLEIGDATGEQSNDTVNGAETVRVGGDLSEKVHGSRTNVALSHDLEVRGKLTVNCHGETAIFGGGLVETHIGPELLLAGMSDDLIVGAGLRATLPADLWLCGLVGMEEKPVTNAADGAFIEISGLHVEREFVSGNHAAGAAVFSGAQYTTTATGFRPLMKVMLGIRNLTPGAGAGGGGSGGGPGAGLRCLAYPRI